MNRVDRLKAVVLARWALAFAVCIAIAACGGGEAASAQSGARCRNCGMRVDPASSWRAGATGADGAALQFDAPKCLFRFLRSEPGRTARDPVVTEYYSGERRPAPSLLYVIGSDVSGPMGRDLVPIDGREHADRFLRDHHGERVLAWAEIDDAVVAALFR